MMSLLAWGLIAVGALGAFVCCPGPTYGRDGQPALSHLHQRRQRIWRHFQERLLPLCYLAICVGAIMMVLYRLDVLTAHNMS